MKFSRGHLGPLVSPVVLVFEFLNFFTLPQVMPSHLPNTFTFILLSLLILLFHLQLSQTLAIAGNLSKYWICHSFPPCTFSSFLDPAAVSDIYSFSSALNCTISYSRSSTGMLICLFHLKNRKSYCAWWCLHLCNLAGLNIMWNKSQKSQKRKAEGRCKNKALCSLERALGK